MTGVDILFLKLNLFVMLRFKPSKTNVNHTEILTVKEIINKQNTFLIAFCK